MKKLLLLSAMLTLLISSPVFADGVCSGRETPGNTLHEFATYINETNVNYSETFNNSQNRGNEVRTGFEQVIVRKDDVTLDAGVYKQWRDTNSDEGIEMLFTVRNNNALINL